MVTLGSAVVVLLLLFGMVRHKNDYLMYLLKVVIFFSVYLNIGYIFRLGESILTYSEALILALVIFGLLSVRLKAPRISILIVSAFVLEIFIGYLILVFHPTPPDALPIGKSWDLVAFGSVHLSPAAIDASFIKRVIRIILYIMVYCIFDTYVLKDTKRTAEIKRFIVKTAVFVAYIGIIEQVFKIFLHSDIITKIASTIFGIGNSQLTVMAERGSLPVLQGLMLEPGHFAQSFIPAIFILFRDSLFTEKQRFFMFLLFGYVIFVSGSFAGFAIVFLMAILYLFSNKNTVLLKIGFFVFGGIILSLYLGHSNPAILDYYTTRINAILGHSQLGFSTSDSIRTMSRNAAYEMFKSNPIFGTGFGTTDAFGFIPTMLANIGLLGAFTWFVLMLRGFTHSKTINIRWLVLFIPILFFIGGFSDINSVDNILLFGLVFRKPIEQLTNSSTIDKLNYSTKKVSA
jgi:hypothetical protein